MNLRPCNGRAHRLPLFLALELCMDSSSCLIVCWHLVALPSQGRHGKKLDSDIQAQLAVMDQNADDKVSLDEFQEHVLWSASVLEDQDFKAFILVRRMLPGACRQGLWRVCEK